MSKKVFGSKLADVMARTEEEGIPRCCRELFSWIIHHGNSSIQITFARSTELYY